MSKVANAARAPCLIGVCFLVVGDSASHTCCAPILSMTFRTHLAAQG